MIGDRTTLVPARPVVAGRSRLRRRGWLPRVLAGTASLLVTPDPDRLSHALRQRRGTHLRERRAIALLSLGGSASLAVIALYQLGIVRHLPEPRASYLDAERVDASPEAYSWLHAPDAVIGMVGFAITLLLTAMGGPERARRQPAVPRVMALDLSVNAAVSTWLTVDQWRRHRAFCSYCLLSAVTTFVSLPLALPEARDALRRARGRDDARGGVAP